MKLKWILCLSIAAMFASLLPALLRADVRDNAQIFSQQAVDDANSGMQNMQRTYNKQLVVETFPAVPDDQQDAEKQDPKAFFKNWMASRARDLKVNGIYVLICMDPRHLEVGAGKNTVARGDFTAQDVDGLRQQMQGALHDKDYDKALSGAVEYVDRAFDQNIHSGSTGNSYSPNFNSSPVMPGTPFSNGSGISIGSVICFAIGAVIILSLIRSIFRGGSGGFGGYAPPGNQGYGGNYGGGMGGYGGGFGAGGGGGGFGRGLLGGLLGGALGGYAENRFEDRGNQGNSGFFGGGGGNAGGGGGGGGSSFDAGPSDAGQGFGDTSSGGDFSGGGGGSSGGGGGSSGGDF